MVAERNIPEWLKVKMPSGDNFKYLDSIISNEILNINNLSDLQIHQSDINADFIINVLDILIMVNIIVE